MSLSSDELVALVNRVFRPGPADRKIAIFVDLPDAETPDTPSWKERREMAAQWAKLLGSRHRDVGVDCVDLILYRNARANNADLPDEAMRWDSGTLPRTADTEIGPQTSMAYIFETYQMLIAPTELSATAPLKIAAKTYGFRAATMPGFEPSMVPALRLDYGLIGRRTARLKALLDGAEACHIDFVAEGKEHALFLDLRHRSAHASGGIFTQKGEVGNLPSGESYIVPYEGELDRDASRTAGQIPVELDNEIVVYRIEQNRAAAILSDNTASRKEAAALAAEPAYGNIAELGLGVLGDFGLSPTGSVLLDEKLGLHIAFGRSEHFGGQVGPGSFSSPDKVVHIDRVYIPKLQPKIRISAATLIFANGQKTILMKDNAYTSTAYEDG